MSQRTIVDIPQIPQEIIDAVNNDKVAKTICEILETL